MEGFAGHGHVFDDPAKKAEMLKYREQGYAYADIARLYGVDHTTIMYHCRKARQDGTLVESGSGQEGPKLVSTKAKLTPPPPRPPRFKKPTLTQLREAEEIRPGWMLGDKNEWFCCGKSFAERKREDARKKKSDLERRRLEMLQY